MIKLISILFVILVALQGCEDPPPITRLKTADVYDNSILPRVESQNSQANSQELQPESTQLATISPATSPSLKLKSGQRISFNEDAASAMAKVRALMAASDGSLNTTDYLSTQSDTSQSSYSSRPTPPPEGKEMLELARNDKATTDIINSALSSLPQNMEGSQTETIQDNLALGTNQQSPQVSVSSNAIGSSQNRGVGVRNPPQISAKRPLDSDNSNSSSPSPSPSPEPSEYPLVKGAMPRGYLMLYMTHPRARELVELQIQNLIEANIENVFIGLLTDGTFGQDFAYAKSALTQLHQSGRIITLAVYLSNGATMRYYDKTPITTGFSRTSPLTFRRAIQFDAQTRTKYTALAEKGVDLLRHNSALSPLNKNIAIPMLEDNLDSSSYLAIRGLVKGILGSTRATIMRSHCLGCYSGNDADGAGDPLDEHGSTVFYRVKTGDGFSFDGAQFLYPGEQSYGLPFEAAQGLASEAERRGAAFFGLWRSLWQGLSQGPLVHPDKRNYIPPTVQELEFDIKLLRAGLD